ncbi:MAG TPA: hypothetical protein VFU14_04935 [Acidimicrobiales bacterium]|nr:hypothetical protein [Acidimicrobiales bacterium]
MNEKTIKDIGAFLTRFGPYLCLVAAIAAVMAFLPGDDDRTSVDAAGQFGEFEDGGGDDGGVRTDFGSGGDAGTSVTGGGRSGATTGGRAGTAAGGGGGGGDQAVAGGGSGGAGGGQQAASGELVANCDPNTGRIAVPSHYAPPCVPAFDGDNGGATYQGVTADRIKLAVMLVEGDAASEAVLTAAGANDTEEQERQQYLDWVEYYSTHYETYGREIEVTFYKSSGAATDDAAGRADAVRIANDGNFAVLNAPNNAFVDELVARGVMCMCTVSLPGSFYEQRAPFVWTTLMDSFQGYVHRAEFIGKRLAGGKAEFAGDPTLALEDRVFGLAYYDDDQQSYRPGIDFFVQHLQQEYGISLATVVGYKGYPDVAESQEAARPLIQKMIANDVTSVVCSCDPFAPIFFTQEATRQNYRPEWIITGSALTDTAFFARTYDQTQWANAFGVSFLTVGLPDELGDDYRKYEWHFGRPPVAEAGYAIIDAPTQIFFDGVHLAGERLDPGTFRDGLFRDAPRATGLRTAAASSFGTDVWGRADYAALDDITLIWWDPQAQGEDETGQQGLGLYRYIEGGKRFLPGSQPNGPVAAFDPAGTVTGSYDSYPEGEAPPDYPPPR